MSTFKDRIAELTVDKEEIFTLILDNCKNSVVSDIPLLPNLKTLSIVNSGLSSLSNFPPLKTLIKLDLSDNKISDGLEHLKDCSNLKQLLLSGNKIKSVEQLNSLSEFESLEVLELISCDINNVENYREEVFKLLPKLIYLDGENRNGEEIQDSEESEDSDEEEEDEFSMADLLKADHSNDFLDDEEPYVPNETEESEDSEESEISDDNEPNPLSILSPSGVVNDKRCKRKATDNGDCQSPKKTN